MQPLKNFKKLQDKWYSKLKKSGFTDLEDSKQRIKRDPVTYTFNSSAYIDKNVGYDQIKLHQESKEEYFRQAGQFYHDYAFESDLDKLVWQYHSEGYTMGEVASILKARKIKTSRTPVNYIVLRLAKIMLGSKQ